MEVNGALNSGLQGLQRADQQVSEATVEIANASARNDVEQQDAARSAGVESANETASETSQSVSASQSADSLVDLQQGQTNFEANTRTVETADEVLGTLIDTSA